MATLTITNCGFGVFVLSFSLPNKELLFPSVLVRREQRSLSCDAGLGSQGTWKVRDSFISSGFLDNIYSIRMVWCHFTDDGTLMQNSKDICLRSWRPSLPKWVKNPVAYWGR